MDRTDKLALFYLVSFLAILVWSAIKPYDYFTWVLEVAPAMIGLAILAATYKRFRLTPMLYTLLWVHMIILVVGGHYTYAHVPLFDWLRDAWGMARNNYDKVGHFAQGFVPAMLSREILLRKGVISRQRPGWLFFIIVSICTAIAAWYELIEWWAALLTGEAADEFLGTQGYVWDTQSDMALAFVGSMIALLLLSRWHDRQLSRV